MKRDDRTHVEPEPTRTERVRLGDDPIMVALVVGAALTTLVALRGGFRGVTVI